MLNLLQLNSGQRVLLVGEGNFTFTISLLKKINSINNHKDSTDLVFISTCYQRHKDLSDDIKSNARFAKSLGAIQIT